jgi:hypothetical protein
MDALRWRRRLFWLGCLPTRVLVAVVAAVLPPSARPYTAIPAFVVAAGFLVSVARNAPRGGFGGPVWWAWARPVHAALYTAYAGLALVRSDYAWVVLACDVLLGVGWYFGFGPGAATASTPKALVPHGDGELPPLVSLGGFLTRL